MSEKKSLPVWPLAGPFYQYVENVKELAAAARLRIVDATMMPADPPFAVAPKADWPKVTLRDEYKPAKAKKGEVEKAADPEQSKD